MTMIPGECLSEFDPEYAECWCCGQLLPMVPGATLYYCEPCGVRGSITPGRTSVIFAYKSRIFGGTNGAHTVEMYIDHSDPEQYMPSPG